MTEVLSLDSRSLLARVAARLVTLRRALGHRHDDDAWWATLALTARDAQRERGRLRWLAHLLNVERATRRGRIHGRYASLDEQRAWLADVEHAYWGSALGDTLGIHSYATLGSLRERGIDVPSWAPLQSW